MRIINHASYNAAFKSVLKEISSVYGRSVDAIRVLQLAIHQAQKLENEEAELTAVAFLAIAYKVQGDFENSLKYSRQSFHYFAKNSQVNPAYREGFIGTCMHVGEVFLKMGNLDSALYYVAKSYKELHRTQQSNRYFAYHAPLLLGESYLRTNNPEKEKIALPFQNGVVFAELKNILYYQANDNYTYFFLSGSQKHLVSKTLRNIQDILEEPNFLRVSRTHLVNLDHIARFVKGEGCYLIMSDGAIIPVAKSQKEKLVERFGWM